MRYLTNLKSEVFKTKQFFFEKDKEKKNEEKNFHFLFLA